MSGDEIETRSRFFDSLKRGTGEAYLLLANYPSINFSNLILKGAITNYCYDTLCEGSRAKYIYHLIKKSKQKHSLVAAVLDNLKTSSDDDFWNLYQLCDLAVLLSKAGYEDAKPALYHRFLTNANENFEFCGQDQLLELDGMKALLTVAEAIGKKLVEDDKYTENSWRVDAFQKRNKTINVYAALKNAGQDNKYVAAYHQSICENKWELPKKTKPKRSSYQLIKSKIEADKFRFVSSECANDLSSQEVEQLAHDFLNETDNQKKQWYLLFFGKRKFPFDIQPLLHLAGNQDLSDTRLSEFAADALSFFKDENIRQLALEKLSTSEEPSLYLEMLVSNYKKGDHKILVRLADRSDDYDDIHSLVFGFLHIYKSNPTKDCREPLEAIYNKINCGIHREDVVSLLLQNNVLSETIMQELPYDSFNGVRRLYSKWLKDHS